MLTVQNRLREIAAARIKAYQGFRFAPEPPAPNPAILMLPFRRDDKMGIPAYMLADIFLQLPPDTKLVSVALADYNLAMALVFESREFPAVDHGNQYPELDIEIKREYSEAAGKSHVVAIKLLGLDAWRTK